jgi:hypothetical protein
MNRVSFDFDGTLTSFEVQDMAGYLVNKGFEVWIVTSRCPNMNEDLELIAHAIGIRNIKYMCFEDKAKFLKDKGFLFHLDDDIIELSLIKTYTDVKPICHMNWGSRYGGKENWKRLIEEICQ